MVYAVILAGGIGSRFWPLSTVMEPKQFLNLCSDKSLLAQTIKRVGTFIDKKNIYIATNKSYQGKIKDCIREFNIPLKNCLFEPESKNTLAPIGVLSKLIFAKDKEAIIVVLPSDHLIKDTSQFLKSLARGIEITKNGFIVTLGIVPQRPETGYGYIKVKTLSHKVAKSSVYKVNRFIEKPSLKMAKKLIKDKKIYWNGGIFIFQAQTLLEEIRKLKAGVYKILNKLEDKKNLNKFWSKFPAVSIDCAVMERTKKLALIPIDCGWIDLGSWQALEETIKKDKNGNISRGNHINVGSKNITVWAGQRLVATLGLNNLVIVDTKDALLVCAKDKTQEIKHIVKKIID